MDAVPNELVDGRYSQNQPIESKSFILHCTSRPKDESYRNWKCSSFTDTFFDTLNHDLCKAKLWLRRRSDDNEERWTLNTIINHKPFVIYTEEKVMDAIVIQMKEKNISSYSKKPKSPYDFRILPFAVYPFLRFTNPANRNEYIDETNLETGKYILCTNSREINKDEICSNFAIE